MKTDIYTKVVLTVIALCLLCIVARDMSFAPPASAQTAGNVFVRFAEQQRTNPPASAQTKGGGFTRYVQEQAQQKQLAYVPLPDDVVDVNIVAVNGQRVIGFDLPVEVNSMP